MSNGVAVLGYKGHYGSFGLTVTLSILKICTVVHYFYCTYMRVWTMFVLATLKAVMLRWPCRHCYTFMLSYIPSSKTPLMCCTCTSEVSIKIRVSFQGMNMYSFTQYWSSSLQWQYNQLHILNRYLTSYVYTVDYNNTTVHRY